MGADQQAVFWGIVAVIIAILLPAIGFIMRLIINPKIQIGVPFRDHRPWSPRVEARREYTNTAGTVTSDYVSYMLGEQEISEKDIDVRYYIHIPIKNASSWRFEQANAKGVRAKLTFYDLQRARIPGEFEARWENSDQPTLGSNKSKLKYFDIRAGEIENIDIASRRVTGLEWYVMDNNSYDNPKDSEIQRNRIGEGGFIVHMKLEGDNIDPLEIIYQIVDNGAPEPSYTKLERK